MVPCIGKPFSAYGQAKIILIVGYDCYTLLHFQWESQQHSV